MRVWDARKVELIDGEAAVLHLLSPDGDQVSLTGQKEHC
jgi:hypothetical protein